MTDIVLDLPEAPPRVTRSIRLPPYLWDELTELAAETRRSRSNLIELAIEEFLRRRRT